MLLALLLALLAASAQAAPLTVIRVGEDGYCVVSHLWPPVEGVAVVPLLGTPHYLTAVDPGGNPLPWEEADGTIVVYSEEPVNVTYVTGNLTSKEGGVWRLDAPPVEGVVTVILPPRAVLLNMTPLPSSVEASDEHLVLRYRRGGFVVEYLIEPGETRGWGRQDGLILVAVAGGVAAAAAAALLVRRRGRGEVVLTEEERAILDFVGSRKGRAYLSEIYRGLGLPPTTVWRKVRRLEEMGFVRVEKTSKGSLVILRR